jgi:hypothetical protein
VKAARRQEPARILTASPPCLKGTVCTGKYERRIRMKKGIAVALFVLYYLISIMFFKIFAVFVVLLYWKQKQRMASMNGTVCTGYYVTGEKP